jgi:hypothetical protein
MGLEAGGEDEDVRLALRAVGGADPVRRDLRDPVVDQRDVRLGQRRIPVVGEHEPLAADLVARRDLAAQLGVVDRLGDLARADRAERAHQPAMARHRRRAELHEREDRPAVEALEGGEARKQPLGARRVGEVALRDRPPRRALIDVDVGHGRLDRGNDLDRTAAGADHRDPLARQVDVVAPASGVEGGPGEAVQAGQRRHARRGELAARGDQHVGLVRTRGRVEQPLRSLAVPAGALHLGAGAHALEHSVAARDVLEIGLDLGLRRVAARPPRVGGEREPRTGARRRRTPRPDRCCGARRRPRARRARRPSRRRSRRGAASRRRRPRRSPRRPRRSIAIPSPRA